MKKILSTIFLLLTLFSFSQNQQTSKEFPGTTLEEYNYMTRGYQIQISSGLDMKSNYSFDNLGTLYVGDYSFGFQILLRTQENEMAGILIIAKSNVSGKLYYLGSPFNSPNLKLYFERDIENWDESMTTAFAQAMSEVNNLILMKYFLDTEK
jgi:hypothetical protein